MKQKNVNWPIVFLIILFVYVGLTLLSFLVEFIFVAFGFTVGLTILLSMVLLMLVLAIFIKQ